MARIVKNQLILSAQIIMHGIIERKQVDNGFALKLYFLGSLTFWTTYIKICEPH